jgi:Glycosyltransferase family 9 (heptosyltransferase)
MLRDARALAKSILPPAARQAVRDIWEDSRDWIGVFGFWLSFAATHVPLPKVLLYFGFAPGDDLLCTAVLRELRKRGKDRLLIVSDHRELFAGNHDPSYVRPLWARYYRDGSTVSICRRFVRIWGGQFTRPEYAPPAGGDRRKAPARHIIAEMCARVGITGPVAIRPYLDVDEEEKSSATWARRQIVIQSSGMAARHPMLNKQWYQDRFQGVVDALEGEVDFIQLGSATDPALQHVNDLRGATSIREAAAILNHARLYVGTVGLLMHLARAVECPGVIVFGGREAPWQSGYVCNLNLYSAVPCAPCWRANTCEFDRRCMSDISVADVVSAIRQMLERPRNPLAVETVDIPPGNTISAQSFENHVGQEYSRSHDPA